MVETDRSTSDVLIATGFKFSDGKMKLPNRPGLGILIDEQVYAAKCKPTAVVVS